MYELIYNKETNKYEQVLKANMLLSRAAFGCIVYPNYS